MQIIQPSMYNTGGSYMLISYAHQLCMIHACHLYTGLYKTLLMNILIVCMTRYWLSTPQLGIFWSIYDRITVHMFLAIKKWTTIGYLLFCMVMIAVALHD